MDALAADVAAGGQEVLAGGDVERTAVRERQDLLEDALAVRVCADERRAVAVDERARGDLRGGGGVPVDEDDERLVGGDRIADGVERAARDVAAAGRDDLAVLQEEARDELRLGDEAAAVPAQVEDDRLRALLALLLDGGRDLRVRAAREALQADDGDLRVARTCPAVP
jgi:hypothetical protein